LEAMSLGCPVICSDTSSLPEVVGDAGEYFDPEKTESICSAIERVVQSKTRRDELVEKGRKRCTIFSSEYCANRTLSIYRSLM
jgi:glycosyltransferase involved in cell wall biosynthesis